MFTEGYISLEDLNNALIEEIKLNNLQKESFPYNDLVLINFIVDETKKIINQKNINNNYNHIKIKSSLNSIWQTNAQNLAKSIKPRDLEIALLTIESNSGLIRTMISGRQPTINTFNLSLIHI